ncbi:MAG: PKD domain-containing protein, partial [Mycobacterium sp.]|nr:PKD domain-containing protein [Mycobacterium sp.]
MTDPLGVTHYWSGPNTSVTFANAPTLSRWQGAATTYFFPSGNGFSDTTASLGSQVSKASTVTVTVLDSGNNVVKTLLNNVSENGAFWHDWDGTNTAGTVVPNGTYTIQVTASNGGGTATPLTYTVIVASGTPGTLTTPAAGATLSGLAGFVFTPSTSFTSTFPITQVSVGCLGTANSAAGNGTWQASADTNTACSNGIQSLSPYVYVTDPLGVTHYWSGPNTSVTFANAPTLNAEDTANVYFFPSGNGFGDTTTTAYTHVSEPSTVTVAVLNSSNTVVKTLLDHVSESNWFYPTWDGTNTAGAVVPDGTYTIQVTASNSGGSATPLTYTRHVASGTPGTLTTPAAGATLSGLAHIVFTPDTSFTSTFPVSDARACLNTYGCFTLFAQANGTWSTAQLTGNLTVGPALMTPTIDVVDSTGTTQTWTGPSTAVSVNTTAIPLTATATPSTGQAPLTTTVGFTASDPHGLPLTYTVNYGDGTAPVVGQDASPYNAVSLSHTYAAAGSFTVNVSVTNGNGGFSQQNLSVNALSPVLPVTLAPSPTSGPAPLATTYSLTTSDATGQPVHYSIAFGDGTATTGTVTSPYAAVPISHTYATAGTFHAGVTVTDAAGATGTTAATVTVTGTVPMVADAGGSQVVVLGAAATLDGSGSKPSSAITSYKWNFGDGSTGTGQSVQHTYAAVG